MRRRKGKKENANALPLTKKISSGQLSTPTKKPLNSTAAMTRPNSMALLRVHLAPTLRQSLFKQLVKFPDNVPKGNEPVFTTLYIYSLLADNSAVSESKQVGRRPVWPNRELLIELKRKMQLHHVWKQGQALHEDCRGVICVCREQNR